MASPASSKRNTASSSNSNAAGNNTVLPKASLTAVSNTSGRKLVPPTSPSLVPVESLERPERPQHITPTTQAIPRPSTAIGRTYTHIHPALLLLYFAQRFSAVVADPVSALTRDLAVLGLAQGAYAVICLPPTTAPTSIKSDSDTGTTKPHFRRSAPVRGRAKDKDPALGTRVPVRCGQPRFET